MKKFKIVTREIPNQGSDFEYKELANYDEAFSYCYQKARHEECNKVELYEVTDYSMRGARLCAIAEFYHW